MKVRFASRFERNYAKAPAQIQKFFNQKLNLLLQDILYPSLRAKKYDEGKNVWQARVNKDWRFYFMIEADTYYMLDITRHPK